MLPIIHINELAKQLKVERRWLIDHWINRDEPDDSFGPAPHFRDGQNIFLTWRNYTNGRSEDRTCPTLRPRWPRAAHGWAAGWFVPDPGHL